MVRLALLEERRGEGGDVARFGAPLGRRRRSRRRGRHWPAMVVVSGTFRELGKRRIKLGVFQEQKACVRVLGVVRSVVVKVEKMKPLQLGS